MKLSKSSKRSLILVLVLLAAAAVLAAVHLTTRPSVPAGSIQLEASEKTVSIPLSQLETVLIQGTVVNGKGEERTVESQGLPLSQLLRDQHITEFDQVTAVADDSYSAVVSFDEVQRGSQVCLLVEEDSASLVVFGDPNSKRNVSNIIRLVVQ